MQRSCHNYNIEIFMPLHSLFGVSQTLSSKQGFSSTLEILNGKIVKSNKVSSLVLSFKLSAITTW